MFAKFEEIHDKARVIRDDPWNFDKCLILVKQFEGGQQVKNICMEEVLFWVRVHDLPLMAHKEHVGQRVGAALRSLEEVDVMFGKGC